MLANYLKLAVRNLIRSKFYSAISLLGLAVGIGCAWLSSLYVWDQLQYNRHHENAANIYKVVREVTDVGGTKYQPGTHPIAPIIRNRIPEVVHAAQTLPRDMWAANGEEGFVTRVCIASPEFLDMFDYDVLRGRGDSEGLREGYTAYLSESFAEKLFGEEDPLGKTVRIEYKWVKGDYKVAGILKDAPRRSSGHLRFSLLTSTFPEGGWKERVWDKWPNRFFVYPLRTYVQLREGTDLQAFEAKMQTLADEHNAFETKHTLTYHVQPLERVHLYSIRDFGFYDSSGATMMKGMGGDIETCVTVGLVGLLVLIVACFNHVNLATARATTRAREIGMRKTVGATRGQLIGQYLGESVLLVTLAAIAAGWIAEAALPTFNLLTGGQLSILEQGSDVISLGVVSTVVFVGLLAGGYPAVMLSRYAPSRVLRSAASGRSERARLRTALVMIQFVASAVLLTTTVFVYLQMEYVRTKDLGFTHDHTVVMPVFHRDRELWRKVEDVLNAFRETPGVLAVTSVNQPPGRGSDIDSFQAKAEGAEDELIKLHFNIVSEGFLDTFEIELVAGNTPFARVAEIMQEVRRAREANPGQQEFSFDFGRPVMLNEAAIKAFGFGTPEQAIGKRFRGSRDQDYSEVVGVFKNYNDRPLFHSVAPQVLMPGSGPYVIVRITSDDVVGAMDRLGDVWSRFLPNHSFEYQFLDDILGSFYRHEMNLRDIYSTFTGLAIVIACLGVLGLISYTAQQRTKEIGIRKTIGASQESVILLLSRDFARLSIIASALAIPIGYYLVRSWLDSFVYRVDLNPLVFVGTSIVLLVAVFGTVSGVAWRASRIDPVTAIRHE